MAELNEVVDWHEADYPGNKIAQAAFEVMMRRGWSARPCSEGWHVVDNISNPIQQEHIKPWRFDWFIEPDPFTALVEADHWYKTHIEKD